VTAQPINRVMAAGRRRPHDQGMSLGARQSAPPELDVGRALRRAIVLLAPTALIFALACWVLGVVFADAAMGRTAAVLLVASVAFGICWQMLERGLVRGAAMLVTGSMLILPIALAAAQPIFASYTIVPLLGIAFALPFLEGRRLAGLMVLAGLSSVGAVVVQSLAPRALALPPLVFTAFNALGLLACVGVLLVLLAAFSDRIRRSLREATEATTALAHQATHDSLTGLTNRRGLLDRLQATLDLPLAERTTAAVLYVDIDEFKRINDTLGHLAGDELLERVAQRIGAATSADATGRPGGDEFVVMVEGTADGMAAARVAADITDALSTPFVVRGRNVRITASIGIAELAEARSAEEVLAWADAAMYAAKGAGTGLTAVFDPTMLEGLHARLELEAEMRQALDAKEFRLEYQPIVDLASGRIVELEALVRWDHPSGRHIGPAEFIPVAEESGLIVSLGRFVLGRALADLRILEDELGEARCPTMSVNVSGRQLNDPGLVEAVATTLAAEGFAGSALRLEITETSMVVGLESASETVAALRSLGVGVVIDDFGTGYSALDYLKRFVVDGVKIDRSFISGLGRPGPDEPIVTAAIAFAHALGLEVTGEGIETRTQLDRLAELGCDRGQGYYLGRPARLEQIATLMLTMSLDRRPRPVVLTLRATQDVIVSAG
jgi:diguanylate cyclase (GGDEF)-like protein